MRFTSLPLTAVTVLSLCGCAADGVSTTRSEGTNASAAAYVRDCFQRSPATKERIWHGQSTRAGAASAFRSSASCRFATSRRRLPSQRCRAIGIHPRRSLWFDDVLPDRGHPHATGRPPVARINVAVMRPCSTPSAS